MIPNKITFKISIYSLYLLGIIIDEMLEKYRPVTYEQKLYFSLLSQIKKKIAVKVSASSYRGTVNFILPNFEALALHQAFTVTNSLLVSSINDNEVSALIGHINQKFA